MVFPIKSVNLRNRLSGPLYEDHEDACNAYRPQDEVEEGNPCWEQHQWYGDSYRKHERQLQKLSEKRRFQLD